MKKRARLIAAVLALTALGSHSALAEAFKNTSQGDVLGAIFLFGAGIPGGIGAGAYALMWALLGRRPGLLLTVAVAVAAWWMGLLLAWGEGFAERLWLPALLAVAGALLAAFTSAKDRKPPNADEPF